MPNLTTIGVTSGVPTSGTGTVSTIDALLAALATLESGRNPVNLISGQTAVAAGAGADGVTVLRQTPSDSGTIATSQVAPTSSAATLIAARTGRRRVTFLNYGAVAVTVGPATVTTANGITIDPGASLTANSAALFQAITAAGTGAIHILEEY